MAEAHTSSATGRAMYRRTKLGSVVRTQAPMVRGEIVRVFKATCGNAHQAARLLGVTYRTLRRWLLLLDLDERIDAIRASAPVHSIACDLDEDCTCRRAS